MVASKNRLEKLEKQTQQGTNKPTWKDLVTIANNPELRGGSLDSLAETLGVTRAAYRRSRPRRVRRQSHV